MKSKHLSLFVAAITVAFSLQSAQAQQVTWTGPNGGTTSTAANWITGAVPGGSNTINFNSSTSPGPFSVVNDVPTGTGTTFGSITFQATPTATVAFTLSGNTIVLGNSVGTGINNATTLTQTVNNDLRLNGYRTFTTAGTATAGLLVLGGVISDHTLFGGVVKAGAGTLNLAGANTYTGITYINQGAVNVASFGSVGNASSPLGAQTTVANATVTFGLTPPSTAGTTVGVLNHTGVAETSDRNFALAGTNGATIAKSGGTGTLTLNGTITSTSASTVAKSITLNAGTGLTTISNGVISNGSSTALGLNKGGAGTVTLNGANTYTGITKINGGTLNAGSLNSVVGGTTSSSLGAPLLVNATIEIGSGATPATLNYTGAGETTDRNISMQGTTGGATITQGGTGALVLNGAITAAASGAKVLTLNGVDTAGMGTVGGVISQTTETLSLTKAQSGTWTLSAANTYTGVTSITGGILRLDATGSIDGTPRVSIGNAAFDVTAKGGYSVKELVGQGSVNGDITVTERLEIGNTAAGNLGVNANGQTYTNLTLGSASTSEFQFGGGAGDRGTVSGLLTLGGNLELIVSGALATGEKYTLFSFGSLSGSFTGIADDTNFTDSFGNILNVNYNDTLAGLNGGTGSNFVTLNVVSAIPEPSTLLLGALGMLSVFRRRR